MKKEGLTYLTALTVSVVLVAAISALAACNPNGSAPASPTPTGSSQAEGGPTTVISMPTSGQQFEQGEEIEVQSESVDTQGILRLELLVDNRIVSSNEFVPQPEAIFVARQNWIPDEPGSHTLQVRAYNPANIVSQSQKVVVQIIADSSVAQSDSLILTPTPPTDQPGPLPTPTPVSVAPTLTPTSPPTPPGPTPTEGRPYLKVNINPGLNVRQGPSTRYPEIGFLSLGQTAEIVGRSSVGEGDWWQIRYSAAPDGLAWVSANRSYAEPHNVNEVPVVTAPPTPTLPPPTATATPPPAQANIQFGVDRTQIQGGECATFFWNVTQAKEVYFQGQGVAGEDQARRECPLATQSYELRVVNQDGTVETKTITIQVEGGGVRTIEMDEGESVDFDNDGRVTDDDGDDFKWVEDSDDRRFEKWDGDDDLRLIPVGPVDHLGNVKREDCDWALDNLNDEDYIIPFPGLAACIRTDDGRLGRIRFQNDEEEVKIEWALW